MTKQKTKKAVVKRMKLTKTGKVKFRHAFTSHLMVRRSSKRKRQLRGTAAFDPSDQPRVERMLRDK